MTLLPEQLAYMNEHVPLKFRGIYRRACEGSRSAAQKVGCLECQGYEDGAVRAVRECPDKRCPHWATRGYKTKEDEESETELTTPGESIASAVLENREDETLKADRLRAAKIKALIKARAARVAKREES